MPITMSKVSVSDICHKHKEVFVCQDKTEPEHARAKEWARVPDLKLEFLRVMVEPARGKEEDLAVVVAVPWQ